ncbi:hypothetical protein IWX49DRAFT_600547 [Phyllosticta citricarpa]|uniref:Rhodopsin domain-containing protein n=1 Tax=Phyllosticta citricarpa TaxID=55181 RepID=A0ABR1M6S0_9PEZI
MSDPLYNSTASSPTNTIKTVGDRSLFVNIAASLLLGSLIFFTALRLSIRYPFSLLFGSDDAANVLSMICAIAQTTLILLAVRKGLGQHVDDLDADQKDNVQQLVYSANILFVASITLSKVATSQLLERLTHRQTRILTSYAASAFTLFWGSAFVLTISITCKPSRPWELDVDRCSNWPQIWDSFGALGLFIEVVLVASPACLLAGIKMPLSSKLTVIIGFGFRLLLIPIEALRLLFLHRSINSTDVTFDLVPLVILTLFEQHYSILAGTIPCLCPTLDDTNAAIVNIRASQAVADGSWMDHGDPVGGMVDHNMKREPSLCRFPSASLVETLPFEKEIGGLYRGRGFSGGRAPTVRSVDLLDAASTHQNGLVSRTGSKEQLASLAPSRTASRERLGEIYKLRGSGSQNGLVSRSGSKEQLASMAPSRTGSRERLGEICMRRGSVATVTANAEGPMSPNAELEGGSGKRRGSNRGSERKHSDALDSGHLGDGSDRLIIKKKTDWNIRYSAADLEVEDEANLPVDCK